METCSLGQLAELHGRVGWKGYTTEDLVDEGPLVLGANEITEDNQLDFSEVKHLTREKYEESPEIFIEKDDILVVKVGSTIGKVAIINKDIGEASINPNCVIVRAKGIDPYYLYYYMCSPWGRAFLVNNSSASGQPALNQETLRKMQIPIVEDKTQKKIASVLNIINSKIENNNRIASTCRKYIEELYKYWFVQFDFPDASNMPYKSSGGKMIWNSEIKREIPENWKVMNLFECVDLLYGFPFSTEAFCEDDDSYKVMRIRDIQECTFSAYTKEKTDDKYLLQHGDLVIGMDGYFYMQEWYGDAVYMNQRCLRIRAKEEYNICNTYVKYQMQPYLEALEKGVARSTVGHLSDSDLKKLWIIIPDKALMEQFSALSKTIIERKKENVYLGELREYLLPLLITGQISYEELKYDVKMTS